MSLLKRSNFSIKKIQPDAETIEKDIHEALCKVGAVSGENAEALSKIGWSRCGI